MPKFRVTIKAVKGVRHPIKHQKYNKWPRVLTVNCADAETAKQCAINALMLSPDKVESIECDLIQQPSSPPMTGGLESDTSDGTELNESE